MNIWDYEALRYAGYPADRTYRLVRVTPPSGLIIDFATACAHLRLGAADGATAVAAQPLVERLIRAAAGEIERYCDRCLLRQEWLLSATSIAPPIYCNWQGAPAFRLPKPPLNQLVSIEADGVAVDPATYGTVIDERLPAIVYGKPSLPVPSMLQPDGIQIRFLAGIDAAADIPDELIQAALMIVATWYENPAGASPCSLEALPEIGIRDVLDHWRAEGFA